MILITKPTEEYIRLEGYPQLTTSAADDLFRSSAIGSYLLHNGTIVHGNIPLPRPLSEAEQVVAVITVSGPYYILGTPKPFAQEVESAA